MKQLFIFDLDGTLGKKTPSFPEVTPYNGSILRKLSLSEENLLLLATGRPRAQAFLGLSKGGLSKSETCKIFFGRIYEDGLLVEADSKIIYNAIEDSPPLFKKIKAAFFDSQAIEFFKKRGFFLVQNRILIQTGSGYQQIDYEGNNLGLAEIPEGTIPLYQQANDVKETYKLPVRYEGDSLERQKSIFEKISIIAQDHLNGRFPDWEKSAKLVTWKDSVEVYPRLDGHNVFLKGRGIDKVLNDFPIADSVKVYVCCDGKNDISLVRWVAERFKNYLVVCPSNLSPGLREALISEDLQHKVLGQDCTEFMKGLKTIIT